MEQQNQNTYTQFFPDGEENGHKGKDYQSGMKGADNPFLLLNGFGMVTGTEISVFVREIKTSVPVLYSLRETSTGGHSEGRARFVRGIRTLQNYFYMFFAKEKKSLIKSGHIVLKTRKLSAVIAVDNKPFLFLDDGSDFGIGKTSFPSQKRRVSDAVMVENKPPSDTADKQRKSR